MKHIKFVFHQTILYHDNYILSIFIKYFREIFHYIKSIFDARQPVRLINQNVTSCTTKTNKKYQEQNFKNYYCKFGIFLAVVHTTFLLRIIQLKVDNLLFLYKIYSCNLSIYLLLLYENASSGEYFDII